MNTKLIFTLPGLILFALAACSDKNSNNIIGYEGTTEESNAQNPSKTDSIPTSTEIHFNLWNGANEEYVINTGHDNGNETSGYWFFFSDNHDGGSSNIKYSVDKSNEYSDGDITPIIDGCQGMCGTISLDKGSSSGKAFAGLAFNVAGIDDEGAPVATDVSDWGGICIAYTSDEDISVEMSMDEATNRSIDFDLPKATLAKAAERNEKCLAWKDFKQSGESSISGEDAAKNLATLRFTIYGETGTQAKLNIMALGSYNTPKVPKDDSTKSSSSGSVKSSSSVNSQSSSSKDLRYDMWNPEEYEDQVYTGLDNGTETSGYWYSFDDDYDGGTSRFSWPHEDWCCEDDSMLGIIEEFGGISGTAILGKGTLETTPFVGIGFNVAGIADDNSAEAQSADASSWGGLCFAYESELDFRVEMGPAGHPNDQSKQDLPGKYVQASLEETEVCIPWSDFKQKEGNEIKGEQAAKQLASIRFTIYGQDGTTGKINIKGFGSLNKVVQKEEFIEPILPESSSATIHNSSSSQQIISMASTSPTSHNFGMWKPANGYQVYTGLDNGTETSGYWFAFNDKDDGGYSNIYYPQMLGNEYSDDTYETIIDYCFGLCGTVMFSQDNPDLDAYAGQGFLVSGYSEPIGGKPTAADASEWGGICFAYESTMDFYVELGLDSDQELDLSYDVPSISVKASKEEALKCAQWSEFKQARSSTLSGEAAATQLVSIRFHFTGKSGTQGTFNIKGFGSYKAETETSL